MSDYHIIKSGRRRLMPLLLLVVMILAMLPMGSFAADETLYGYRVSYDNTQTQLSDTRWMNAQLGDGWAEGDWVPYQLVLTGLDGIDDVERIAVAYDFYNSQKDAVLVDLVRGFQFRATTTNDNIELTDSQMGYPSSQTTPITTVDLMEDAQTNPVVGLWDGFTPIVFPKTQINVGYDGTNFVDLNPTDSVAHFYITKQQLIDAGVPDDVKSIVLYFQLHLSRTSLWSSGLYRHYADGGVPAEEWGGHIYGSAAFSSVTNLGSYYYPGASGHAKLIGTTRTVPIPIPSQNLGSVTGYKWHDMDGDGIKDAEEAFLANWPIYISADIEGMSFVLSTMTDANGVYSFPTLTYGTRYITEGVTRGSETGWSQTFPVGEFDVTAGFAGFDNYNDYLNDIAEGSGVVLGDQGYMIVIDRNNYTFSSMNFGNRMTGDLEITKLFDYEGVEGFEASMLPDSIDIHITGPSFLPDGKDFSLLKADDYYLLLENLLPGDYSITEINVPDGWNDPNVPIDVTVIAGDIVDVEFTNVFMTGELRITKDFDFTGITGFVPASMLPDSINVKVTGPSYPAPDGEVVPISIDDLGDGTVLLENLIPGTYTVAELSFTGSEKWDSDIDPASVEVVAGAAEVVVVSITNTFMPGELRITKDFDFTGIVGFDPATMLPDSITVKVTGPSYPTGTEVTINIDDLGDGTTLLQNLIPGDYYVEELAFTGSDAWDSDIDSSPAEVKAGEVTAIEVTITNTFEPGELRITKAFDFSDIEGFVAATMLPDSITVEVTGPSYPTGTEVTINIDDLGDGTKLLENLIPGDYYVEELAFTDSEDWDSDIVGSPAMVEAGAYPVIEVSITNTFMPGSLKITKAFDFANVVGFDPDTMLPDKITVVVTGDSYPTGKNVDITINNSGAGAVTLNNLIPGSYTVDELAFTGSALWDSDIVGSPASVVAGAQTIVEVAITNTFMPGDLEITKFFDYTGVVGFAESMLPASIGIHITGPSFDPDGKDVTLFKVDGYYEKLENLIPGKYSIDEINVGDEWEAPDLPIDVDLLAEQLASVEFTNVYVPGDLEITKLFDYEGVEGFTAAMLPATIDIHVEGPSYDPDGLDVTLEKDKDYYVKLENLLPGNYEITEIDVAAGWMKPTLPIEVTVENGEVAEVEFTNVFMTGSLKISKSFVGGMSGMYPEFIQVKVTGLSYPDGKVFDIEIDALTGLGEITLNNLIPGSYTVSELAFAGSDGWSSSISGSPASVAANAEAIATVTITNTMQYHDETAWAFGENENWDYVNSGNWGWNIGPIEEGYSERHDLIAGAGGNIVDNGTLVGHVDIDYTGGIVTVTYHMLEGFELMDTHVWIGETNLPTLKNGKMTDSPGQFPYEDGASVAASGEVYVAAHAVVRMPGN